MWSTEAVVLTASFWILVAALFVVVVIYLLEDDKWE